MAITLFATLGVTPFATKERVDLAYSKKLAEIKKAKQEEQEKLTQQLNFAYGVVVNPRLRERYISNFKFLSEKTVGDSYDVIAEALQKYCNERLKTLKENFSEEIPFMSELEILECFEDALPSGGLPELLDELNQSALKKILCKKRSGLQDDIPDGVQFNEFGVLKEQFNNSAAIHADVSEYAIETYHPRRLLNNNIVIDIEVTVPLSNLEMLSTLSAKLHSAYPLPDLMVTNDRNEYLSFLVKLLKLNFFLISPENEKSNKPSDVPFKDFSVVKKQIAYQWARTYYSFNIDLMDHAIREIAECLTTLMFDNSVDQNSNFLKNLCRDNNLAPVIIDVLADQLNRKLKNGQIASRDEHEKLHKNYQTLRTWWIGAKNNNIHFTPDYVGDHIYKQDVSAVPDQKAETNSYIPVGVYPSLFNPKSSNKTPNFVIGDTIKIGDQTISMTNKVKVNSFSRLQWKAEYSLKDYIKDIESRDLAKATSIELAIVNAQDTGDINLLKRALGEFRTNRNPIRRWFSCFGIKFTTTGTDILNQLLPVEQNQNISHRKI